MHEPAHHAVPTVLIFCQRADDALLERTHAHSIPDITNPLAASNLINLIVREPQSTIVFEQTTVRDILLYTNLHILLYR